MYRDAHHLLHNRQEWSLRPEALALREHPSLIPRLDRRVHNDIHRNCPAVPLLGFHALQRTLRIWTPDTDTLHSLDNLMFAIDKASRHEKSHPIESELAQLSIQALELQRPFLQEALHPVRIIA